MDITNIMADDEGYSYKTLLENKMPKASTTASDEVNDLVRTLRWDDKFFANEEGLIAVFDFDYEKISSFKKSVASLSMLFPPVLIFGALFCCYPCLYQQQIDWDVYSQHVAITRDGIKFVKDKRKTGCGCDCMDAGKSSKTVPFDKITDCDVHEPAGATCCCVQNVLSTVMVDTASSGGGGEGGPRHELALSGLKNPMSFKKLVWAMKRANASGGGGGRQVVSAAAAALDAPSFNTMDRGMSNEVTNSILRDIHSELVEMNKNMKDMKG